MSKGAGMYEESGFFKGFVPTRNKACLMKFAGKTPEELMREREVEDLPEFAGILSEDTILIDVDDKAQADILYTIVQDKELPCKVIETTRGLHFYMKNGSGDGEECRVGQCHTGVILAIGIKADIKVGCKNSYSVLKYDGRFRETIYDKFDDEEYAVLPDWLLPTDSKADFTHLGEGDGRNSTLYAYILSLQKVGIGTEDAKGIIRDINRYVLRSPLSEKELEVIIRDGSFQKPSFFKGNHFKFDEFARYLLRKCHIIKLNGQLAVYDRGVYRSNPKLIENVMIHEIPTLNQAKRKEVLAYLEVLIRDDSRQSDARYIAFSNGILDIETGEMQDFSPDIIIANKIEHRYNPQAYSEVGDRMLSKIACNDKDIRAILEEMIGYPLYRKQELRRSFLLLGEKSNGKSTYLDILETILGEENTTALDLSELGDRFKTAELFGKLANIGDDIGDDFIQNPAVFKKVVSGDRLNAEFKGRDPFDFSNYAKMFFSANNIPRIKDKTGAVLDRLVIVPFKATFSRKDKDYDPYIKYKLREEPCIEYFIRIGVEGLRRVLANLAFTESAEVKRELEEYDEQNNPAVGFFKDTLEKGIPIAHETTRTVYGRYAEFCLANGYTAISNIEFSKQVRRYFGFVVVSKTIRGRSCRIFLPAEEA